LQRIIIKDFFRRKSRVKILRAILPKGKMTKLCKKKMLYALESAGVGGKMRSSSSRLPSNCPETESVTL
jgi:hypothetical protein